MKYLILTLTGLSLLAGCASFQEAYYIDHEFGQATQKSLDQQVAYPNYPHAKKTPETTEGITAENIMDVYNETFAEEPEDINVFQFGVEQ